MIQYKIYSPEKYRDYKIIIRNVVGTAYWEYIVCIKGEIYTANVDMAPGGFWRQLFFSYTDKEIESIMNYLRSMAMTTIDVVAYDNKPDPEEEKRIKAEIEARKRNLTTQ